MKGRMDDAVAGWLTEVDDKCMEDDEFRASLERSLPPGAGLETAIETASFVAGSLTARSPSWDKLAAKILIRRHNEGTPSCFIEVVRILQDNKDLTGRSRPLLDEGFASMILSDPDRVERIFGEECSRGPHFEMTLFGWKTLFKSYLMRVGSRVVERPDHMWFRVALFIHGLEDEERLRRCFRDLRMGVYTHATPTLFNAGARRAQMASCFPWDAVVYTPSGGRPISSIGPSDMVLTHRGVWKRVVQVHRDVMGDDRWWSEIVCRSTGTRIMCTSDHPILTVERAWVEAASVGVNDTIVHASRFFPVEKESIGWIDAVASGLVIAGNASIGIDDDIPDEVVRAIRSSDGLEMALSAECPEWIPVILRRALEGRNIDQARAEWQSAGSTELNMWYEQWVDLVVPSRDFVVINRSVDASHDPNEVVYTLGVEDDHSYVVGGVVAQNCFLLGTEDSLQGIFKTLSDVAEISKWAGGVGLHISNIRADRSYIYGTNGRSNGILPMIRLFNDTSRYIDQCFGGDTRVWTRSSGWTPISRIRRGDMVVGGDGQYHEVSRVVSHGTPNDGFIITTGSGRSVFCTKAHDFLEEKSGEHIPIGEWTDDDRPVMIRPEPEPMPPGHSWTIDWTILLARIVSGHFVIKKTHEWVAIRMAPSLPPGCCSVDGSVLRWARAVVFPWAWDDLMRPIPPTEWLCDGYRGIAMEFVRHANDPMTPEWEAFRDSLVFIHDKKDPDRLWSGVEETQNAPAIVYDLVVDGEEYMTELGVVHNGGGKRNGAFAIYLEPWHADIFSFLYAKKNTGPEEERARDLFYACWIPDLFMKRVQSNDLWSLMCPKECPGLSDVHGKEFDALYTSYEERGMHRRRVSARELFHEMLRCQIETGTPYFMYKDACNRKSNQKHLGCIRSSNLCVAGSTFILTEDGYRQIGPSAGEAVRIWNGAVMSDSRPLRTSKSSDVIVLVSESGKRLTCTRDHEVILNDGSRTRAARVSRGDALASWTTPDTLSPSCMEEVSRTVRYVLQNMTRVEDKHILRSSDYDSIAEIQLNLELWGVRSTIINHKADEHAPPDRKDYMLVIRDRDGLIEKARRQIVISEIIASIEILGRDCPTFCVREPANHSVVFQGILTGQCTEIIEYSDSKEYAVCNLASISLPRFVRAAPPIGRPVRVPKNPAPLITWLMTMLDETIQDYSLSPDEVELDGVRLDAERFYRLHLCPTFDHDALRATCRNVVRNLNLVIDKNKYPTPETRFSNSRHRPIGVGVQGLADVFCRMRLAFDSPESRRINQEIFESIYYACLSESVDLAEIHGPHETFDGSPLSQGIFHWEMCDNELPPHPMKNDWEALRRRVLLHGARNSLLVAPMPTASTSQILGNNECFEPYTSNFYIRRTQSGEFMTFNHELFRDLSALGLWNEATRKNLVLNRGSIAAIRGIPPFLARVYRTVWEMPQKSIIEMAHDRHFFIDQSQSMNIFLAEPSIDTLAKIHMFGWMKGLKTGSYYIRTRPPLSTPHFAMEEQQQPAAACPLRRGPGDCTACSS